MIEKERDALAKLMAKKSHPMGDGPKWNELNSDQKYAVIAWMKFLISIAEPVILKSVIGDIRRSIPKNDPEEPSR